MSKKTETTMSGEDIVITAYEDAGAVEDAMAAPAAEPPAPAIIAAVQAGGLLAERDAPGGTRIGTLADGAVVAVVDTVTTATGDWAKLEGGGYVKMRYLSPIGLC